MNPLISETKDWSPVAKASFRFFAVYFSIYMLTECLELYFFGIFHIWDIPITWTGRLLLGADYKITAWPLGTGDTTFNYLRIIFLLAFSLLASLIWWALDHRRRNYDKQLYWLFIVLRYTLCAAMVWYGMAKVFGMQFLFPQPLVLDRPLGRIPPMGLIWAAMSYSTGYSLLTGLAEVSGGLFLLFRRTKTFGTLLCAGMLANIAAMNLSFDICVKQYSIHLLLASLFLLLPDLKRLRDFFFLNKTIHPVTEYVPAYPKKWMRIASTGLKISLIGYFCISQIFERLKGRREYGPDLPDPPLAGHYEVETFTLNADTLPPMATDSLRWNKFYVRFKEYAAVKAMNGKLLYYYTHADTINKTIDMTRKTDSGRLAYTIPDKDHLILKGRFFKKPASGSGDSVYMRLRKKDMNDYILVRRRPHWVHERPFNWEW